MTEVNKGQVAEEEIHGSVEKRADHSEGKETQVSHHCDYIDQEEEGKIGRR